MTTQPEPTVITLNSQNSVQILVQYVELAQSKGAYMLNEAELLKRASDVLVNNLDDQEVTSSTAKQLLIQGVHKGQRHGAYTLNDAALLSKVVQYVSSNQDTNATTVKSSVSTKTTDDSNDLSELAEPIPLKPKEI